MDELLQEMIAPAPSRSDKARRRRLASTALIVALAVVGVASLTTSALFTDNQTITGDAITTGTVDLTATGSTTFNVPSAGLAPGDSAFALVKVTNSGSLAYRYAVRYQATDVDTTPGGLTPPPATAPSAQLSTRLVLAAYVLPDGGTCDATGTAGSPLVSAPPPLKTDAPTTFIGDVTTGSQGGDRELAATASETLCFRVDLPLDTPNDFQDTSSTITLRFDAEQTVNNP